MNRLKRVEDELASFILFGSIMTVEERQKVAELLFLYLFDPAFPALLRLDQTRIPAEYPNWYRLLRKLLSEQKLIHLTRNNEDFAISVARETLEWCKKMALRFQYAHSYTDEEQRLKYYQQHINKVPADQWEKMLSELPQLHPESATNWEFYAKTFKKEAQVIEKSLNDSQRFRLENDLMVLKQNILRDWETFLHAKKTIQEEEFLEEQFAIYHGDLLVKAGRLQEVNEGLAPFYNFLGHAWNDDMGAWDKINWKELEEYAESIKRDRQLRELADLLGRWQETEQNLKEQKLSQLVPKEEWKPNPYGKSEIIGIHHSNQISAMLPSETALLSSRETEIMLAKKYVEHKLLTFQYRSQDVTHDQELKEVMAFQRDTDVRGPIIMLIDTSGSMFGAPERIAKALALAILNIALEENRKAYVISFSVGTRSIELTGKTGQLATLVDFLLQSFHGGTDLHPGLKEALAILKKEAFQKADVLVISDFVIPRIEKELYTQIQEARIKQGTHFHSMFITRRPDPRVLPLPFFDNHWIYDLDNPGVIRQTIDHFEIFH